MSPKDVGDNHVHRRPGWKKNIPECHTVRFLQQKKMARQPLHFVSVTIKTLQGEPDPKQRKAVRSAVMKDFLRQLNEPQLPKGPAIADEMSKHISRFRTPKKTSWKDAKSQTSLTSSSKRLRALKPVSYPPEDVSHSFRSSTADIFQQKNLPMSLPVDGADSDTMQLLEYYHTGFWENSFAGNPEGVWLSIALSDAALFHANLCLVAQHRRVTRETFHPQSYYWHRGEAIRIISDRLRTKDEATSDATISAVAILSNADNHGLWPSHVQQSHIEGLARLVELRGGLEMMTASKQIKRVIAWADLLHAISHDQYPKLRVSSNIKSAEKAALVRYGTATATLSKEVDVPPMISDFLGNLRVLSATKSSLILKRDKEVCKIWSSFLYSTERYAMFLSPEPMSNPELRTEDWFWQNFSTIEAFKAALAIFTFHDLRDLPPTSAFFDGLLERLVSNLNILFNSVELLQHSGQEDVDVGVQVDSVLTILLWMLLQVWKVTGHRTAERVWANTRAADLCARGRVSSFENFSVTLQRVVYSREHCPPAARAFWVDIKGSK